MNHAQMWNMGEKPDLEHFEPCEPLHMTAKQYEQHLTTNSIKLIAHPISNDVKLNSAEPLFVFEQMGVCILEASKSVV